MFVIRDTTGREKPAEQSHLPVRRSLQTSLPHGAVPARQTRLSDCEGKLAHLPRHSFPADTVNTLQRGVLTRPTWQPGDLLPSLRGGSEHHLSLLSLRCCLQAPFHTLRADIAGFPRDAASAPREQPQVSPRRKEAQPYRLHTHSRVFTWRGGCKTNRRQGWSGCRQHAPAGRRGAAEAAAGASPAPHRTRPANKGTSRPRALPGSDTRGVAPPPQPAPPPCC